MARIRKEPTARVAEQAAEYGGKGGVRFIDLFCGIGGFRIAFERAGGRCVFSSDYDKFSQQTYQANFGERPHGDIHSSPQARLRLAGKPRPMLRKE